jgi:hypothetical protein
MPRYQVVMVAGDGTAVPSTPCVFNWDGDKSAAGIVGAGVAGGATVLVGATWPFVALASLAGGIVGVIAQAARRQAARTLRAQAAPTGTTATSGLFGARARYASCVPSAGSRELLRSCVGGSMIVSGHYTFVIDGLAPAA